MRWLLTTLVVVVATMTSSSNTGVPRFQPGVALLHLSVDESTGLLYVGAVNHVYQLSADHLQPLAVAVTGTLFYTLLSKC